MMTSAKTPASQFANAIDFFFGHNPANPFWALVAVYLRKEGSLKIVENYAGNPINIISPLEDVLDGEAIIMSDLSVKAPEAIIGKIAVVGDVAGNQRLQEIMKTFEEASYIGSTKKESNILHRHQWEANFLLAFASRIIKLDNEWVEENFNSIFDIIVRRCFANERFERFTQPKELTELVGHLIGTDTNTIYNPFAGTGTYSKFCSPHTRYVGEELVPVIAAIGNLRMMGEGIDGEIIVRDSVNDSTYDADLIVSTPPFNPPAHKESLRCVNHTIVDIYGRVEDYDEASMLLNKCATEDIRAIILTTMNMNSGGGCYRAVREFLIAKDCVDMVINLPAQLFTGNSFPYVLYVLNPNHSHKGSIRFIDASRMFIGERTNRKLDTQQVIDVISNGGPKSITISLNEIIKSEYDFSPELYLTKRLSAPDGYSLLSFDQICSIQQLRHQDGCTSGHRVSPANLSTPNATKIFTPEDFEMMEIGKHDYFMDCPGILLNRRLGLKGFYIDNKGERLYYENSLLHLTVNSDIIMPQYLVLELMKDYVEEQIVFEWGRIVRVNQLRRLRIAVPSLEQQRREIEAYQSQLIANMGVEISLLRSQQANEFERNMHLRKHALKQVLNEIVPASRRIANFINSQNGEFNKKSIVAARSKATLDDYAQKLYLSVEKIQRLISVLTDDEQFHTPETFDFSHFMAYYCQTKMTGDLYNMVYLGESNFLKDKPEITAELKSGERIMVTAPALTAHIAPEAMETVLDNLVANAVNHGFTDENRKDYCIKILFRNLIENGSPMLEVRVMNNGAKLPAGMSPDKVFCWGIGRGTGLGSWQVKNIIEHYGGSVEFIQHDNAPDGFNIEYQILIPMI